VSIDWRFGRGDGGPGARRPAEAEGVDEAEGDVRAARSRRLLAGLASVAVLAIAILAAHAWRNAVALERSADDVRAVVAAEEAARARGDGEVARMHQTAERHRLLRGPLTREALYGLPPPLPGLTVVGAGTIDDVDVAVGAGGRIARASAELVYVVTDGEITGTFRAARPMQLGDDGRWRHGLPELELAQSSATETTTLHASGLSAIAPAADRAWLEPALQRAAAARERYCRMRACGGAGRSPLALAFTDVAPGSVGWQPRRRGGAPPVLELAAPSRALRPMDAAADALLGRALTRIVLALGDQGLPAFHTVRASQLTGTAASFTVGLVEAALAAEESPDAPERWGGPGPVQAWTLADIWPRVRQQPSAPGVEPDSLPPTEVRLAARDFGAYIARSHGQQALEDLMRTARDASRRDPRWDPGGSADSPWPWLEAALGDAAIDAVLGWPEAQAPAPDGLGFVAACLKPAGEPWAQGQQLLVRSGEEPQAIGAALCGAPQQLGGPPSAAGGRVAAVCGETVLSEGESESDPSADPLVAVRFADGRVQRTVLAGAPPIFGGGPAWSSDGRWLVVVLMDVWIGRVLAVEQWVVAVDERAAGPSALVAHRLSQWADEFGDGETAQLFGMLAWQPDSDRMARVVPGVAGPSVLVHAADAREAAWTIPGIAPAWSPDGRRLAIVRTTAGMAMSLAVADARTGTVLAEQTIDVTTSDQRAVGSDDPDASLVIPRLTWSPDGLWIAARVRGPGVGPRLVAWNPDDGRVAVAEHDRARVNSGAWNEVWHPEAPVLFLVSDDLFRDLGRDLAWWGDTAPPQLALDVARDQATVLEQGDPALEVLHWPLSPDGRWRVRRDDAGQLEFEPVGGGTTWRLNAPGCSAEVDWLEGEGG